MKELSKLVDKYQDRLEDVMKISFTVVSTKSQKFTPVGETGDARRSWTPNLNSLKVNNKVGGSISTVINTMKVGDTYYFANGIAYIRWLEYKFMIRGGKKIINRGQEGQMVTRAVAEWGSIVKNATKKAIRNNR